MINPIGFQCSLDFSNIQGHGSTTRALDWCQVSMTNLSPNDSRNQWHFAYMQQFHPQLDFLICRHFSVYQIFLRMQSMLFWDLILEQPLIKKFWFKYSYQETYLENFWPQFNIQNWPCMDTGITGQLLCSTQKSCSFSNIPLPQSCCLLFFTLQIFTQCPL